MILLDRGVKRNAPDPEGRAVALAADSQETGGPRLSHSSGVEAKEIESGKK